MVSTSARLPYLTAFCHTSRPCSRIHARCWFLWMGLCFRGLPLTAEGNYPYLTVALCDFRLWAPHHRRHPPSPGLLVPQSGRTGAQLVTDHPHSALSAYVPLRKTSWYRPTDAAYASPIGTLRCACLQPLT